MTLRMRSRREVRDSQRSFSGGLNLAATPEHLGQNELRRAENCHLDARGGLVKRRGLQKWGSTVGFELPGFAIQGGVHNSGQEQVVIVAGHAWRKQYTGLDNTLTSWTDHGAGVSATDTPSFARFRDASNPVLYIADGGALNKYGSASITADISGTPGVTSFIWTYNNRLFSVGSTNVLNWSDLDNGDTLGNTGSGGGSSRIGGVTSSPLVAGCALGASNILFHENGVSRFVGWTQDDINISTGTSGISPDIGTIAPHSIIIAEQIGYFMSDHGFYRFSETTIEQISNNVDPLFDSLVPLVDTFVGDLSILSSVRVVQNREYHEIMWHIPGHGCYCYNYRLNAWVGPMTGYFRSGSVQLTAMWSAIDGFGRSHIMTGWSDGEVRIFERPGDSTTCTDDADFGGGNGVSYKMVATGRRFYFNTPTREKAPRRAWVHWEPHGSENSSLSWQTRHGSGSAVLSTDALDSQPAWGSSDTVWGATGPWGGNLSELSRVQVHGRGEYQDFTFTCPDNTPTRLSMLEAQAHDVGERAT